MVRRAAAPGFVEDVLKVFEAFVGEGRSERPVIFGEVVVDDADAAVLGEHADSGIGDSILCFTQHFGGLSQGINPANCRHGYAAWAMV